MHYNVETTGQELVNNYLAEIKDKVILTTGVSLGGLGAHFLAAVAVGNPALLILAGRNLQKCHATADAVSSTFPSIRTKLLELDLGSFQTVRKAAEEVLSWDDVPHIDILVNNAGIMAVPFSLSPDGHESQFASNHLGHFLFTNLIMPKMMNSDAPRVISVSSAACRFSHIRFPDINFHDGDEYEKWTAYGQSKTANMLFAMSLAKKLGKRLLAFSLHPGSIKTNLSSHLNAGDVEARVKIAKARGFQPKGGMPPNLVSLDQGIATHVFACFEPSLAEHNGVYLLESRVSDPYIDFVPPWGTADVEAEKLWRLSETMVGQDFTY